MAPRKGSLMATVAAAKAQVEAEPAEAASIVHRASGPPATTAINLPRPILALLRRVAVERANQRGGRPSVSAILAELVERHRDELEREASSRLE